VVCVVGRVGAGWHSVVVLGESGLPERIRTMSEQKKAPEVVDQQASEVTDAQWNYLRDRAQPLPHADEVIEKLEKLLLWFLRIRGGYHGYTVTLTQADADRIERILRSSTDKLRARSGQ
jgi:hypothetical protein